MPLLVFSDLSQSLHCHTRLVAATIATRYQHIMNFTSLRYQAGYGASANELGIIGMCHYN
jgi:hypothetical protein